MSLLKNRLNRVLELGTKFHRQKCLWSRQNFGPNLVLVSPRTINNSPSQLPTKTTFFNEPKIRKPSELVRTDRNMFWTCWEFRKMRIKRRKRAVKLPGQGTGWIPTDPPVRIEDDG